MYKEESLFWRRASLFLSALFFGSAYFSSAFASSGGQTNDCTGCHTAGATTVMIIGPTQVAHDSVTEFELQISGDGPGVIGGLNVRALQGGVLGLVDAATRLEGGQITHMEPKAFDLGGGDDPNTVSWLFEWTAPSELDSYDLIGWGVNANSQAGSGGDFAGMTTFTVQVVPIPAAGLLFGSALGLLAWLRRRIN
ncbi:MAG: hypothetical protein OER85_09545 [Gammaproteobacteria bacterium]|nr:hypothetical protein [Gammaproteobacteria bacterium]